MESLISEQYLNQAIQLAEGVLGTTSPNPAVGAIIVKDNKIISKGATGAPGKSHAEIVAINNAKNKTLNSTLYVSLEPCSHYGRTPPCTSAIISAKIKKVVIGMKDPNPLVNGKGLKILKKHKIEVEFCLQDKAREFYQYYIKFVKTGLPYVTLKTGITIDGKICTTLGESKWITSKESREFVHRLRSRFDGIITGVNTIIKDNPVFRVSDKKRSPFKIIFDSKGRVNKNARIFKTGKTIIVSTEKSKLKNCIIVPSYNGRVNIKLALKELAKLGFCNLFLEAGGELNSSFINLNCVDRILVFIAPKIFGGRLAKTFVEGDGIKKIKDSIKIKKYNYCKVGDDLLIDGYINWY